jgi:hypothetical protein
MMGDGHGTTAIQQKLAKSAKVFDATFALFANLVFQFWLLFSSYCLRGVLGVVVVQFVRRCL